MSSVSNSYFAWSLQESSSEEKFKWYPNKLNSKIFYISDDTVSSCSTNTSHTEPSAISMFGRQLAKIRNSLRFRKENNSFSSGSTSSKHINFEQKTLSSKNIINCDTKETDELDTKYKTKKISACKSSKAFSRFSKFINRGEKIKQKSFSESSKKSSVNKSINRCLTWPDTSVSLEKSFIAEHLKSLSDDGESAPKLEVVLRDQKSHEAFKHFLKKEFSDENIDFWSEVEGYRTLKCNEKRQRKGNEIYNMYIRADAPNEVNVSYSTKMEILKIFEDNDPSIFDKAQNQVLFLMESDSFKRFVKSIF